MTVARQALVLRAQGGDGAALERLIAECQSDARRYALRHCTAGEVDDAVQEALLIVARHVSSLKSAASFAGWLFSVVRRECARLSRRMFGHEPLDDDRPAPDVSRRPAADLRMDLAAALEALPQHDLEMILLRDCEELTISEICTRLHVTVPVAKARLRRARLLVRDHLQDTDDRDLAPRAGM